MLASFNHCRCISTPEVRVLDRNLRGRYEQSGKGTCMYRQPLWKTALDFLWAPSAFSGFFFGPSVDVGVASTYRGAPKGWTAAGPSSGCVLIWGRPPLPPLDRASYLA